MRDLIPIILLLVCTITYAQKSISDSLYMHLTTGTKGGVVPMGSIKSKVICILIPRSKQALQIHDLGLIIKSVFFVISASLYIFSFPLNYLHYGNGQ